MTTVRTETSEINDIDRYLIHDKSNPLSFIKRDKNNDESYLLIKRYNRTVWTGINNITTNRTEVPNI